MQDRIGQLEAALDQANLALKVAEDRITRLESDALVTKPFVAAGMHPIQPNNLRIALSEQNLRLFGVPEAEFGNIVTTVAELIHPEDRHIAQREFEDCAINGTPFDAVHSHITAKGQKVKARFMGEPVRDRSGKIIAVRGAMQVVTDLLTEKAENLRLANKIQETIDGLPDGFVFLDSAMRLTYLNHRAEYLLGLVSKTSVGRDITVCVPELANSRFAEVVREVEVSRHMQQVAQRLDSLAKSFAISIYPVTDRVAILLRDVTQDEVRNSQIDLLQKAVSKLNDMVLITKAGSIDGPDDPEIVFVNDAFIRRTGFTLDEVIGKTPRILQGPETQRAELDKIRRALETGRTIRTELINYTKDRQKFWLGVASRMIAR